MAIENFDTFILHFPELDRRVDFHSFWKKSITDLKSIPIDPVSKKNSRKNQSGFITYEITFKSAGRTPVTGILYVPVKTKKPRIIIHIHDYNNTPYLHERFMDPSLAYFVLTLRGHGLLKKSSGDEEISPGFMTENILDKESYYVLGIYLDTLRAIEMLRLIGNLDCSSVGIIGRGLGAACAVFAASYSERVRALVLDSPSFCELPLNQNIAKSDAAREINEFITHSRKSKKQIKLNLTYFDALNFSDMVRVPVLMVCGFKDILSPPECVFGMFNRLKCDKTIEVYPEEGHEAGGLQQLVKSLAWLKERVTLHS